ncbi:MAG: hypothetical protein ACKVOI_13035 [Dongiaceae bacterium]
MTETNQEPAELDLENQLAKWRASNNVPVAPPFWLRLAALAIKTCILMILIYILALLLLFAPIGMAFGGPGRFAATVCVLLLLASGIIAWMFKWNQK